MNILFSKNAWEQYVSCQKQDQKIVDKINELLKEIQRNPFRGKGHPEPLRHNFKGYWSRRINSEHRLTYRIVGKKGENQRIEILTCLFHYK